VLVQRREDAHGELRRAASVDQLKRGVQVDIAVRGDAGGEVWSEARREQTPASPFRDRIEWGG
jgi:hypothetical protein